MAELGSLLEKLRRMEALHARTTFDGEREAAEQALESLRQKLRDLSAKEVAVELSFPLNDAYSHRLFLALSRRYGLQPYRYRGQRRTTVMLRAPRQFVEGTLWPQFLELDAELHRQLGEITNTLISQAVWEDSSDAGEMPGLPGK
jgi:hypothetical protein